MRVYLIILVCFVFTGLVSAQEDELTPYEVALERIAEVEANDGSELYLSNLGLTELPSEIGNLWNLQYLYLNNNLLINLPSEIGNLHNLRRLETLNNQLSELPSEIGSLQNLEYLYLDNNQLSHLPSEIGNLHKLEVLHLFNSQIEELPAEIGQLEMLCSLDIRNNQVRSLPNELGRIRRLTPGAWDCNLYIEGNPLVSPPDEVLEQGTEAILAYLRNQAWWHLQRMMVSIAGGIGLIAVAILGLRWRNRRGKRDD